MNELSLYNRAKQALAECRSTDEVQDIRDKAMALRIYAQQAEDRTLERDAIEIRFRAERRLGEMMAEQPKAQGGAEKGVGRRGSNAGSETPRIIERPITYDQAGIDKNLAKRARKLARMTDDEFEAAIGKAQRTVSVALDVAQKITPPNMGVINSLREVLFTLKTTRPDFLDREADSLLRQIRDRVDELLAKIPAQENVTWLSVNKSN